MLKLISSILSLSLLAGCGFHPMYGGAGSGFANAGFMVNAPRSKSATMLKDAVLDALGTDNTTADYAIDLGQINRTESPMIIDKDRGVSRYGLMMITRFSVTRTADDQNIYSGESQVRGGNDVATSLYTTQISSENEEKLMIKELARDIVFKARTAVARTTKSTPKN